MSYILEALKKSQQEREMGEVPRLQASTFDATPTAEQPPQHWIIAAVGLAVVAVAIAIYTALRVNGLGADTAASPRVTSSPPAAAGVAPRAQDSTPAPANEVPPKSADALDADDPEDLSVAPRVLVVPAPPKPGERLPRGADELRRAVLGPDASPSVTSAQPRIPPEPAPAQPEPPETAPLPDDLLADIEAFKNEVRAVAEKKGTSVEGVTQANAKATAAPQKGSPKPSSAASQKRPPALSAQQRLEWPEFSMTVHVYDPNATRRFVYVNGRKVREKEETKEGFRLERVVADGAILSYKGERFFQAP